jgi:hypothetical protein
MDLYGNQLRPVLRMLIEKGDTKSIRPKGLYFERIIARAMLSRWKGYEQSEFVKAESKSKRTEKRNEE